VFVKNATEGLNLLALGLFQETALKTSPALPEGGGKAALPLSEHHSNFLPWIRAAEKAGGKAEILDPGEAGLPAPGEIEAKIWPWVRVAAFALVSHVLGARLPVEALIRRARSFKALTVLDCAQGAAHIPVNVKELGVDFAVFSGHKLYGPLGSGFLYGRRELLETLPPVFWGGNMTEGFGKEAFPETSGGGLEALPPPARFEAGTQDTAAAVGLAEGLRFLAGFGWDRLRDREGRLMEELFEGMAGIPGLRIIGSPRPEEHLGVVSWTLEGVHPHDLASFLDQRGICIRAGHHCAPHFLRHFNLTAACRVSLGLYNTRRDIARLIKALREGAAALSPKSSPAEAIG
ncbi:MAG: aminotransferase class V-fold PLP-dependent enzyme, partial [Spirochaetales bacterium]|nr:aminotransferase class V-fold PLP-dependent enzyme [Spirochaetales bacterium]